MNGLLESFDKGIKEGIKEGIKKGVHKEKIDIAKKSLNMLDNETISLITGLDTYEIENLRKNEK
ncbi:MAG: hypothetical protein R3Y64_06590 [Peptostreptococcaceae bacterium]